MNNKYRVDWQAGMRLTDEIFRSADEFHLSCLQPLYSVLVNGDYGFLSLPIFRYELTESTLSVTELQAEAITNSGKLIQLSFTREDRLLFQNVKLPDTTEPFILYIDKSSDKTVKINGANKTVPLCDADYQLLIRAESEHYNNPDAVPLARFMYKHGWSQDSTFIAPCVALKANGTLLRSASNYAVEVDALVRALKEAADSEQYILVMSILPSLVRIMIEVQKESDAMTPRHLITLMQEGIQIFLSLSDMDEDIVIPGREKCVSFVDSHYTPCVIHEMVDDGIELTHALISIVKSFRKREVRVQEPEVERARPVRRTGSTDSIRKKHH